MDPKFFRKYADIIAEAQKPRQQLDEGAMDMIKGVAAKLMSKFSSQEIAQMKAAAQSVLGKPTADASDFTLDNIKAISQKLGVQKPAQAMEEGVVDVAKGAVKKAGDVIGGATKKVSDYFGQTSVDPKSGQGNIGPIDAWNPRATLGEKLASLSGILGGTAATIAGFFGGPAWLIIPGILALMFLSQVGGSKETGRF